MHQEVKGDHMRKVFVVFALAAALALSFALAGCSNSGPEGGADTGDPAENMAAQEPEPGFDVEQAVFDKGLGEFVRYYAVENEDGSLSWGVVTHDVNGDEVTTYFDNSGKIISGGLERGDVIE